MANYQDIKGFNVQSKSTDPVPYAQELINNPYAGAWSSGNNMNTDRWGLSGAGIQTAAIAIDGLNPNVTDVVEQYNGSTWTEITENNTGRNDAAAGGTSTATIFFGGYTGTAGLNRMQYMTIASLSDSTDFGDLLSQWSQGGCFSNSTRGIVAQGYNWGTSANQNVIQYFTIASLGDSADFGDATKASNPAGNSNGHGGIS